MLADASDGEREVLEAIPYRDTRGLASPRSGADAEAQGSLGGVERAQPTRPARRSRLTYWRNALQGIDKRCPLFVTLNPPNPPRPELTFGRFTYAHPQFISSAAVGLNRLRSNPGRSPNLVLRRLDRLWLS